jgi:hypothetical protein
LGVRGDSLRDLYAKTLALLGLGVLAGAGAVVDFWPAGVRLSPIASALPLPETAQGVVIALAEPAAPTVGRTSRAGAGITNAVFTRVADRSVEPLNVRLSPALADVGTPVAFIEPVMTVAENTSGSGLAASADAGLVQPETPLDDVALYPVSDFWSAASSWSQPVALDAGGPDDPGFFAGAFRKTGSSILRTGARTGASIVGAVRVVGVAVRRALPN